MNRKVTSNPYLIFSPFLFYYAYYIIKNKWPTLYGDELRYVNFATNLMHGFYSPNAPHINLWNGPGYPILLLPFIALKIPALYTTLMNAVYQYLSVVFLYKALKLVTNHKTALLFGLLLAIYPNALSMLPILYTEAFTYLLVSSVIYVLTLYYTQKHNKYLVIAGLLLGYLTLTKIIFGYVLIVGIMGCVSVSFFKKDKHYYRKAVKTLAIAFAVTIPYLVYTYSLTNKPFYWGDSGGMSLYWMSTPYEHEYGDWKIPNLSNNQYPTLFKSAEGDAILKKNHAKEVSAILKHNEIEQDELFKQAAISNIKKDPFKFISNYYFNWARMLFNFPYSYAYQDSAILGNIIRGSLILWASVIGIIISWRNWKGLIYPVKFLLLITGIYLALSGALSAYPRQFDVILPILLFWIGFLKFNLQKPNINFVPEENLDDISLNDLAGMDISIPGIK